MKNVLKNSLKKSGFKFHKYGAMKTKCMYDHMHDSKKEAMWCVKLHELQKEKGIKNLKLQQTIELKVNGTLICKHIVDFTYSKPPLEALEVLEVKGMKTRDWIIKHKLFMALYPLINYVVV